MRGKTKQEHDTESDSPTERTRTIRQTICDMLRHGPVTAREMATALSMRDRDVIEHLEHVVRSLRAGERLVVEPATCRSCGACFEDRTRLTRPSRCPSCKSERVAAPKFRLE